MKKTLLLVAAIFMFATLGLAQDKGAKLTADEIVAKHLASIGKPEDLATVKSLIFNGDSWLSAAVNSTAKLEGQSQFGSEGTKMVFAAVFNSNQHPYDKVAYDGKSQSVGLPNGQASVFSAFFKAQPAMTKYGIFGGTLSTAWGLYDTKGRKIKLDFGGLTKIDGKDVYKLKYSPGDDFRISLYFEADTFRHVMTEYEYTVQAGIVSRDPTANSASKQSEYKLIEKFGDFKTDKNLTLPRDYTVQIDTIEPNSGKGTKSLIWHMQYREIFYNEPFQEGTFKVG